MRLRKKMGSGRARLFAENFDARLPGIVIWSDRPYFDFFYQGTLKSRRNHKIHKIQVPKFQGRVFWVKKSACGRHIDHGGWERARHSHILQVYRHPTSTQTPHKYTDTQQLYRHTTGIQYPEYKSRHLKIKSRHPKTNPKLLQMTIKHIKININTLKWT